MLARIDGKSPVEYLTEATPQHAVRRFAGALVADPVAALGAIALRWQEEGAA